MTAIALTGHQLRYDLLAFRRNRQARFATLLLPPLLLILFVSVGGDGTPADARLYLPGLIALGIISSSLLSLTIELVIQRETGDLKRRRAAAAPAWALIAGRTLTAATISLAVTFLLLIIAGNAYDLEIPTTALPALALFTVAGSAAFAALAYAAATAIRSASAAQPRHASDRASPLPRLRHLRPLDAPARVARPPLPDPAARAPRSRAAPRAQRPHARDRRRRPARDHRLGARRAGSRALALLLAATILRLAACAQAPRLTAQPVAMLS
jgi:ABC-type transport system involved in cytochrome c biogenesis permease component